MLTRLTAVLAALLTTTVVWAPSASAYEPREDGTYNVPRHWGTSTQIYRIVRTVETAITETPGPSAEEPNPVILISSFLFDRDQSADALIAACRRGVSVRVIMDADIDAQAAERVMKVLNGDNINDANGNGTQDPGEEPSTGACGGDFAGARDADPLTDAQAVESMSTTTEDSFTWGGDRSYAKMCNGSCRGAGGNMHSKFYAFSRTGTADNVVMVSSSNLNYGGAALGWNDLYTMRGDSPVEAADNFAVYNQIHREMTDDDRADDQLREHKVGDYTHRFFPMRNADRSNDPTLADLNKIGCRSAFGRTQVHVSQFYWAKTRGMYLAAKLIDLARAGCGVHVIHAAVGVDVVKRLRDAARRHEITLYDSRWDFNHDGNKEIRAHSKYVLVKGKFGTDSAARMVMTGTANWVDGSLSRGDENTLNIKKAAAYQDYIENWNDVRQHSRKFPNRS